MATEIIMPTLGETMDEGTIARWLVGAGQVVSKGQAIAEIETNKAVFELEAPAAGVLHIVTPAGVAVPILTVIGSILAPGEEAPSVAPGTATPASSAMAVTAEVSPRPASQPAEAEPGRLFVSPRARRLARESVRTRIRIPPGGSSCRSRTSTTSTPAT